MVSSYFFVTSRDIMQVYSTTQLWLMTYLDTWWLTWIPFKDLLLLLQLRHDFVGYVLRLSVSLFSSRLLMPLCKMVFLEVLVLYIHSYVPFFSLKVWFFFIILNLVWGSFSKWLICLLCFDICVHLPTFSCCLIASLPYLTSTMSLIYLIKTNT